ncbi:OmpA family protein [uncultured Mailhella sp.]|uniref:OmpA family protein n=1 Tax=uncultured Mailhella sp. TaxID=1981031 RepID=UPI002631E12F|nr:OmpA family protein [uncultured Mailhella sp.]
MKKSKEVWLAFLAAWLIAFFPVGVSAAEEGGTGKAILDGFLKQVSGKKSKMADKEKPGMTEASTAVQPSTVPEDKPESGTEEKTVNTEKSEPKESVEAGNEAQAASDEKRSFDFGLSKASGSISAELEKKGKAVVYLEFVLGKADVLPQHMDSIDEIAEAMKSHPEWKLSVEGHTDKQGRPAWNKKLSKMRADAICRELKGKGIDPERLSSVGWGDERPLDTTENEAAYAKNRRVELHLK